MCNLVHQVIRLFSVSILIGSSFSYTCKNENGEPVDWFVMYKLPKTPNAKEHIANGVGYMYITSKDNNGWILSENSIDNSSSLLGRTISDLFSQEKKAIWLAYNDQAFLPTWSTGHTKGIVGTEKTGGFWIVHSIPHFPGRSKKYKYPRSGHRNGQSILCISASNIDAVGDFLLYNQPHIYVDIIQKDLEPYFPKLTLAANKKFVGTPPWNFTNTFSSLDGVNFQVFSKAKQFKKDLYEWVADTLHTDLLTETWPWALVPLRSSCSGPYRIMNVKKISDKISGISFPNTKDHSKWAVSPNSKLSWICIGDINRAVTFWEIYPIFKPRIHCIIQHPNSMYLKLTT